MLKADTGYGRTEGNVECNNMRTVLEEINETVIGDGA
jgi:hypothetical protein